MVFVSISARLLINVEALNMVESIGNVTRHRRATVIVFDKNRNSYSKVEVPAISGESIAHAFQEALVLSARTIYGDGAPICAWCARGEFFKSMDNKHTMDAAKDIKNPAKFEEVIIKNCLVEDIGGFLRADRPPVKRTSRFQVGYLVPTYDAISSTVLDTQFHVRHAPSEVAKERKEKREEREVQAQMIYYVETGGAVYGFNMNIDIDGIGKTSMLEVKDVLSRDEREKRIRTVMSALLIILSSNMFGAKRTRFLPIIDVKSAIAAVSDPIPFTVAPAMNKDFIESTLRKRNRFLEVTKKLKIDENINLYAFSNEVEIPEGIVKVDSIEHLLECVTNDVLKLEGFIK